MQHTTDFGSIGHKQYSHGSALHKHHTEVLVRLLLISHCKVTLSGLFTHSGCCRHKLRAYSNLFSTHTLFLPTYLLWPTSPLFMVSARLQTAHKLNLVKGPSLLGALLTGDYLLTAYPPIAPSS